MLEVDKYNKKYPPGSSASFLRMTMMFIGLNLVFYIVMIWQINNSRPLEYRENIVEIITASELYFLSLFFVFLPALLLSLFLSRFQSGSIRAKRIAWIVIIVIFYFLYFSAIKAISMFSFG